MFNLRRISLAAGLLVGAVCSAPAMAQQYSGTWSWDLLGASNTATPTALGMSLTVSQTSATQFSMLFQTTPSFITTASGSWAGADFLNAIALKGVNVGSLNIQSVTLGGQKWDGPSQYGVNNAVCDGNSQCFFGGSVGSSSFADINNSTATWKFDVVLNQATSLAQTGLHLKMDVRDSTFAEFVTKKNGDSKWNIDNGNNTVLSQSFTVPAVPEPETYAMMLAGLGVIGAVVRRRRQTQA